MFNWYNLSDFTDSLKLYFKFSGLKLSGIYSVIGYISKKYSLKYSLINKSIFPVKGPVHINVPLREPLYFNNDSDNDYPDAPAVNIVYSDPVLSLEIKRELLTDLKKYRKILIIAGTSQPDHELKLTINELLIKSDIVFIPDITSNMQAISKSILQADLLLNITGESDIEFFQPSLLISFGGPMVSKSLRQFLRTIHGNLLSSM